jgi:hypothetical protein
VFHANTQLPGGRPSILIDPGSKGNLGGDATMRGAASCAVNANKHVNAVKRKKPLSVTGVGTGGQTCEYDCTTSVVLRDVNGEYVDASYTAPTVDNSELPLLLGLQALIANRCILDFNTMQLHMCGPGGAQLNLSPGSRSFPTEQAPSGHLVLPCCDFAAAAKASKDARPKLDDGSSQLTLVTTASASSSSSTTRTGPAL